MKKDIVSRISRRRATRVTRFAADPKATLKASGENAARTSVSAPRLSIESHPSERYPLPSSTVIVSRRVASSNSAILLVSPVHFRRRIGAVERHTRQNSRRSASNVDCGEGEWGEAHAVFVPSPSPMRADSEEEHLRTAEASSIDNVVRFGSSAAPATLAPAIGGADCSASWPSSDVDRPMTTTTRSASRDIVGRFQKRFEFRRRFQAISLALAPAARFRQNVWESGARNLVPKNVWLSGTAVTYRSFDGIPGKGLS